MARGVMKFATTVAGPSAGPSLAQLEAAVAALTPYSWIEADNYTVDGTTGKVASLPDKVAPGTGIRAITAGHALVQATSANQCAVPSPNAEFASQPALAFLGAQAYQSNAPNSAWGLLHRASHERFLVQKHTGGASLHFVWSSGIGGGGGACHRIAPGSQNYYVFNPGTSVDLSAGAVLQEPAKWEYRHDASTGAVLVRNGKTIASGTASAGYSSGDPTDPYVLGAFGNPPQYFSQQLKTLTIDFNRVLNTTERNTVNDYINAKYRRGPNTVFAGNSLVSGTGATGGQTFPYQTSQLTPLAGTGATVSNLGVGGRTWADMAAAGADVDGAFEARRNNILVLWETTNTILASTDTTACITAIISYINARLAANPSWKIVLMGTIPRFGASNTAMRVVDNYLAANYTNLGCAAYVDPRAPGSPFNFQGDLAGDYTPVASLYSDTWTHLSNAGYGVIAAQVATRLATIA